MTDRASSPMVLPIELQPSQVRPVAYRVMSKKHGLNLKTSALEVLAGFLGHQFGAEWRGAKAERFLDSLSKMWKDEDRGVFVDGEPLSNLISQLVNAQLSQNGSAQQQFDYRDYFKVVNAHEQRRFVYNHSKKHFELAPNQKGDTLGQAESLMQVFPSRYHILSDRIHRNDMFQPSAFSTNTSYSITKIKNMLGRVKQEFFLFGLLTKPEGGDQWVLLDDSSKISLEFTELSTFAPGHYFTEGSFAICVGVFLGDTFQVGTLGPPPVESRQKTREAYGSIDFYGITSASTSRIERVDPAFEQILISQEQKLGHKMVVLGCDIHLDKQQTLAYLRKVFTQLSESPPLVIVLLGSFFSRPFQPGDTVAYREAMSALALVLQDQPELSKSTKFILVPGDNDPWHALFSAGGTPVWPLIPVPKIFAGRVDRAAADVVWASNPCRICYLSQEILISRDDCGKRLRRHALPLPPGVETLSDEKPLQRELAELDMNDLESSQALEQLREENDVHYVPRKGDTSDQAEARKVIATVLDQCHLSPFPLSARPIMWEHDLSVSMAQWPSSLFLVDPTTPRYKQVYEGCHVMNPGPFKHAGKAHWIELDLSTGQSEHSSLLI